MTQKIKQILAQKGEGAVKDSIVKSVRDFKNLRYDLSEILDTIETMYGVQYIQFAKNQWYSI